MNESKLYINLQYYKHEMGYIVTLEDVKAYLEEEHDTEGNPKFWENENSNVTNYIEWFGQNKNDAYYYALALYDQQFISVYQVQYPDFPDMTLFEMPLELVKELIKKSENPDYEMQLINIE